MRKGVGLDTWTFDVARINSHGVHLRSAPATSAAYCHMARNRSRLPMRTPSPHPRSSPPQTMGSCNPRLARATNKIMARHYPERLGYALIISAPWLFNATWTAMKTFLDPDTVSKIRFVKVGGHRREACRVARETPGCLCCASASLSKP